MRRSYDSEPVVRVNKEIPLLPHTGDEGIEPKYGPFRKGDVMHSLADISRAGELLGYAPQYNVAKGIEETMRWYVEARKRT